MSTLIRELTSSGSVRKEPLIRIASLTWGRKVKTSLWSCGTFKWATAERTHLSHRIRAATRHTISTWSCSTSRTLSYRPETKIESSTSPRKHSDSDASPRVLTATCRCVVDFEPNVETKMKLSFEICGCSVRFPALSRRWKVPAIRVHRLVPFTEWQLHQRSGGADHQRRKSEAEGVQWEKHCPTDGRRSGT